MSANPSELRFCSITDAKYLAQVIVMHRSLRDLLPSARNDVLCMDARSMRALEAIGAPGLTPVAIEELEGRDPELVSVRDGRSRPEYAHTAKAALCVDVLRRHGDLDWITYVDADSMFFGDPGPVFAELEGASVGIVRHRFAPRFRGRERWATPYCSSWVSFAAGADGREAADWWRQRCLEWCFHRVDSGRYGDQGYLRDWPDRFPGVHVIRHPGLGPAPWTRSDGLDREESQVMIDGAPLILFHYQSLRVHPPRRLVDARHRLPGAPIPLAWRIHRGYRVTSAEQQLLWQPYLARLGETIGELRAVDSTLVDELRAPGPREVALGARRYIWMRQQDLAGALDRIRSRRVAGEAPSPE